MTTIDHPKMPNQVGHGSFQLTTYDNMSSSPSKLKWSFG